MPSRVGACNSGNRIGPPAHWGLLSFINTRVGSATRELGRMSWRYSVFWLVLHIRRNLGVWYPICIFENCALTNLRHTSFISSPFVPQKSRYFRGAKGDSNCHGPFTNPRGDSLNVRHLAELAGVLSVHSLSIVESPSPFALDRVEGFREACRKRTGVWFSRMQDLEMSSLCWSRLYGNRDARSRLIEEILVSELLTRMVSGLLAAHGQLHDENNLCRIAGDLFHDAQKARRLALRQMLEMADAESADVRELDRRRRSSERWTDLVLGPLQSRFAIKQFTFDAGRSREFGQAILPHLASGTAGKIISAGIGVAFPASLEGVPSHAGLHRDVAAAILSWLPPDLFDADGGIRPLRSVRAARSERLLESRPPKHPNRRRSEAAADSQKPFPSKISFHQLRRLQEEP